MQIGGNRSTDMLDWSDLRHFLAVARTGSTLAAARHLGVNQTTCARRITALEEELGLTLFERGREGYRLLEQGRSLLLAAERVEAEIKAFLDQAAGNGRRLSGTIRVTTNEPLANIVVARAVSDYRSAFPSVNIELLIGDQRLDIARGEADVALRVGTKPTDPVLVARQLGVAGWAAYCSHNYAEQHGRPTSVEELPAHTLVSLDHAHADWLLFAGVPDARAVCRSNSIPNLNAMVKAGLGVGGLPCIVGDLEPELVRCFAVSSMAPPVWLVFHERNRSEPHVRSFLDFLSSHVLAKRALLAGA
jgi:DNA-binding transcriptional LysR family regulator